MLYSAELRRQIKPDGPVCYLFCRSFLHVALCLLDASLLTCKVAEVEDACATDLSDFVEFDLLDGWGLIRENPLDSDTVGHLTDGKGLGVWCSSANLENYSAEALKSELVAFLDLVGHGDCVTCLELRVGRSLVFAEGLLH